MNAERWLAPWRRGFWRLQLALGRAGLLGLGVALAAGAGTLVLAWGAPARDAALAQAGRQLAEARRGLDQERQAAAAWPQRPTPSVPAAQPASGGMKLDPGNHDEFVDPAQPAQPAQLAPPRPPVRPGATPAQALLDSLPPLAQRDDDLALVQTLAREAGLGQARTQYRRLEARSAGIDRLEIALSDTQGFETWRVLMVALLNRLPHASVSGLAFTRAQPDGGGGTAARLSVVLHHRAPSSP